MIEIELELMVIALLISYLVQLIVVWEGSKSVAYTALTVISFGVGAAAFYIALLLIPQVI